MGQNNDKMTDAGEKLVQRARTFLNAKGIRSAEVNLWAVLEVFARAQLERAAEIADRMAASTQKDADSTPDQAPISKEAFSIQAKGYRAIAAAIRKLKE